MVDRTLRRVSDTRSSAECAAEHLTGMGMENALTWRRSAERKARACGTREVVLEGVETANIFSNDKRQRKAREGERWAAA